MNEQMITCCRHCSDRHVGCHAECEKYKAARQEHDEWLRRREKSRPVDDYVTVTGLRIMRIKKTCQKFQSQKE